MVNEAALDCSFLMKASGQNKVLQNLRTNSNKMVQYAWELYAESVQYRGARILHKLTDTLYNIAPQVLLSQKVALLLSDSIEDRT